MGRMPELPEVETIRKGLENHVIGEVISDISIRMPNIIHGQTALLKQAAIVAVRRLSKLLILDTSKDISIAIHLKMTGRLILFDPQNASQQVEWEYDYLTSPHTHMTFLFESGKMLFFHDYRRFGTVDIVATADVPKLSYVKHLGKEFFRDLKLEDFLSSIVKSNRCIKTLLLDQSVVAGVGNIYANEALWEAQIHPAQPAKSLTISQKKQLFYALEEVMKMAIEYGGASSDNFRNLFEAKGKAQDYFAVYGKQGESCIRCGTTIIKNIIGGRGTYICPSCQTLKKD